MDDLYPKFIIIDGDLILSKVKYHKDILGSTEDPIKAKDRIKGGWYRFSNKSNTFTFYGESTDFGPASIESIQTTMSLE